MVVTFRVSHPRPGFPAEFNRLECPWSLDEKVGEVVPRVDAAPVGSQLYAVLYATLWVVSRLIEARRA